MLRLRQHIRRDPPRIALRRDNHDLGRPRHKIDPDFPRDQLLRRRNINISRPDNPVDARHRLGSKRERRDRLRAAHAETSA